MRAGGGHPHEVCHLCHQFRWHAALSAGREALRSGRLGRLLFLDCSARYNISGQGTHILDYAMWLNADSPVTRVFGAVSGGAQIDSPHPGPDSTVAQLEFANGVRGLWSTGLASPQAVDEATPWKHVRIAAYAERGRTLFEEFGRWQVVSPDGVESGRAGDMQAWAEGNLAAQAGLVNAMLDCREDDARPAGTNLKLSLHEWNVALAPYASALWRRPVNIPFDPPDDLFANWRGPCCRQLCFSRPWNRRDAAVPPLPRWFCRAVGTKAPPTDAPPGRL